MGLMYKRSEKIILKNFSKSSYLAFDMVYALAEGLKCPVLEIMIHGA